MIIGLGTDMELYRHRARVTMRERFDASVSAKSQTDTMNYVNRVGTSTSYVSYIGNLVATRISSLWGFTGPAFTITEGSNSVYRCLDVARDMLLKGDIDAAVIGGVDLCGSAESLYLKTRRSKMSTNQEPTISFDQSNDGFFVGEGCGALVLRRLEECDPNSSPQIYCTIDGVGCSTSVATAANTAVQQAHITTNEIDYVEISADGEDQLDTAELIGLSTSMSNNNASVKSIAVGCAKATVGHTGYASGAASLIKTALCLHNRFLPELPSWSGPKQKHARTWNNSNFYICPDSRAWVKNDAEHRHASVSGVAQDGQSCYNVVMSDVQGTHEDQNKMSLDDKVSKLIIIRGNTIEQLKQRVVQLRADCSAENNDVKGECPLTYHQLIKATVELEQTSSSTNNALTLCVVTTAMKLQRELKSAERGLEKCQNSNNNKTEWTSPSGSYFTTEPIRSDRIAFVYGDGASPYYGLGRDLNRLVPSLHEIVNEKTTEMWSVGDEAWNTRQVDKSKMEQYANDFSSQTVDLFRSGVYHSVCHTSIARDILGIAPKCAFGLSMGEVAMLFAFSNANSKQSDEMTRRLNSSKVWTQELAVEFNALRREWNVDAKADVSEFWQGYVVHASRTQVEQCVRQLRVQHVRLVIVNDDKTCIIAGFPQECEQLISALNIKAGKIDQSMVGHYPEVVGPLKKDVAQIHNMLSMPSGPLVQGVELLTCVGNVPYTNMKHRTIHENIGALYSEIADFQQITETAYSKGYDVFIELGAGDLRSAAIGSILKGRKHLAVSIDRKNIDPWSQMMRMLAKLISHGVQANVSKLYHKDMLQTPKKKSRLRRDIELNAHYVSVGKVKKDASSGASTSTSVNSSSSNGLKLVPGAPRHQIIETLMDANGTITAPKAVVYDEPEYEWNPDLRDSEGNQLYTIENDIAYQYKRQKEYKGPIIWNYDDLLQYAEGDIEPVFGPDYAILDTYQKRVRLPKREYLLCSRVCSMTCKTKCFEKCSMITEYDLPINGELSEGGDVPWAVLVESGQCDLMLCSYVGVDFQCKGERAYRLLDTTLKFFGVAQEGQTLNYDIKINGYANRPDGSGECSMFFFEYNCYVDGKLLIEMRNGVAGFFNEAELAAGKGVVHTPRELKKRAEIKKEDCTPYLINPSKKLSYSEADMQHLSVHGRNKGWGSVMPSAAGVNYKLCARKMLMIDRVTSVDPTGGAHGLGLIIGEKILERDAWFFPCHFHKDQVMAGSLVADGCSQMLKLYMIWLGLHHTVDELVFRPVPGIGNKVRCRGAIGPQKGKLVYVMEITEMGYDKKTGYPFARALVNILNINFEKGQTFNMSDLHQYGLGEDSDKRIVVDFQNIALRIEGKPTNFHPKHGGKKVSSIPRAVRSAPQTAMVNRPQPPSKFMFHGGPKLGKETLMTWHPLAGIDGNPTPGFQPTAYPPRAVAFVPFPGNPNDYNHEAGVLPLGWFNLMEFTANRTSLCLGKEFARFDGSNTSRMPAFDLQLVTRVLTVEGMDMTPMYGIDRNPSKGIMTAEFDCPADAWFFQGSSSANHMPYSIIMEIALQVSGVLTSWLKAPLCLDRDDLLFRNLDAKVTLVKDLDLRGKTIKNVTTAKSYSMLGTMGVHSFHAELSVDGEVFYIVDTSFGWFLPEVFEKQTGMDQGKTRDCWHLKEGANDTRNMQTYNLRSTSDVSRMFAGMENQQVQRRSDQVNFVDEVNILSNGGKHGKGYVSGNKIVNKQDWFFSCHFWCDPVMPGSLGIESMFECIEYWAVTQGWTKGFKCASFAHGAGETSWKYRGQLTPRNDRMDNEVHIKTVTKNRDGSIDIVADGGLYVDHLRVYDAVSLRVRIEEATVVAPQRRAVVPTPTRRGEQKTSSGGRVLTVRKSNMLLTPQSPSASGLSTPMMVPVQSMSEDEALAAVRQRLLQTNETFHAHVSPTGELCGVTDDRAYGSIEIKACTYANLGDPSFLKAYNCTLPLYTGAMAKGIASAELVVAAGKEGVLASLGAGGLPLGLVDKALDHIQTHLSNNEPYAVNLIHSPFDDHLEKGCVDLLLKRGVRIVEASAFMALTPHVVRYRVAGLRKDPTTGKIICDNKIIFKVSRTELAEMALRPAPKKLLKKLLKAGEITKEQAEMSKYVPMCDDIAVEADSGGHTDNRPIHVILPLIMRLRDRITKELKYGKDRRVRVGVGGGIGCPEAALAAFSMGAAFVVTGTINQMCRQAGTCDYVRKVLSEATYSDVTMAPAADMFDQGVELQVIKKGTLFASRARKLFQLFQSYDSLDEIPKNEMKKIEKRIFQKSCDDVWEETRNFYINRLKDPEKVKRAEEKDPKLKMSMTFRWYLSKSSGWANRGGPDRQGKNRQLDYQIWCGPAIGSFNEFIKGTYLDPKVANAYPDVVQINKQVLFGACYLRRLQSLTRAHEVTTDLGDLPTYVPGEPL